MVKTLNQILESMYATEEFNKAVTCSTCWNYPAVEGAMCADCLHTFKVKVSE